MASCVYSRPQIPIPLNLFFFILLTRVAGPRRSLSLQLNSQPLNPKPERMSQHTPRFFFSCFFFFITLTQA